MEGAYLITEHRLNIYAYRMRLWISSVRRSNTLSKVDAEVGVEVKPEETTAAEATEEGEVLDVAGLGGAEDEHDDVHDKQKEAFYHLVFIVP